MRERQARTGEAYLTALRHVLAGREGGDKAPVPVVEMEDVSAAAQDCGLRFRAVMFPALRQRVEPKVALQRLRQVLDETADDPAFETLRSVLLGGEWRQAQLDVVEIMRRAGMGSAVNGAGLPAARVPGSRSLSA